MACVNEVVGGGMEIWSLVKANIRHKKGSFVSIIILMLLISMALTAILSVQDNCKSALENALVEVDTGNLNLFIKRQNMTEELTESVLGNEMVKGIKTFPAIVCDKQEIKTQTTNGQTDGNAWFLQKMRPEIKLLNSNLDGYESAVPELDSGEIYITQGICTRLSCDVGDTIKLYTIGGNFEVKITGIIIEPSNGSSVMGWKQVFISDEDFDKIYEECKKNETDQVSADFYILQIYKDETCTLSDAAFKRNLNLETGIVDYATGSLTKELIIHYACLFPDIICSVLVVFVGFLMLVVLIVMGHSITTGIEMDYVNLGVLKSQGFTKNKIQIIFMIQYILAQIIGTGIGLLLAIPLTQILGGVFQPITAILVENNISIANSLAILIVVLLISGLFIVFVTRKIGEISPVRALSGGREEVYFDSRIKMPIRKKALAVSLALRQFTSNKRQYMGTILIVTILMFFMATVMILGDSINSKSAMESMGELCIEVDVKLKEPVQDSMLKKFEKTVEEYSAIEKKYYINTLYLSINGEELYCFVYQNPEAAVTPKGRAPLYDNEIIITEIVAEELGLKMGDKVTVSNKDKKEEYIISGLYQAMNDTGMCFSMSLEGARKIGVKNISWGGYSLADTSQAEKVASALNEEFGHIIEATAEEENGVGVYTMAIDLVKVVIYSLSVIFALVVVQMVCSKTFMREKIDIGIYKALGFTPNNLRLQFAIRFLVVALIGSAIGSILCVLFSGKVLGYILRMVGISSFTTAYTPLTFMVPIGLICVCFFLFAYLAARKIKKVEVKELVVE